MGKDVSLSLLLTVLITLNRKRRTSVWTARLFIVTRSVCYKTKKVTWERESGLIFYEKIESKTIWGNRWIALLCVLSLSLSRSRSRFLLVSLFSTALFHPSLARMQCFCKEVAQHRVVTMESILQLLHTVNKPHCCSGQSWQSHTLAHTAAPVLGIQAGAPGLF